MTENKNCIIAVNQSIWEIEKLLLENGGYAWEQTDKIPLSWIQRKGEDYLFWVRVSDLNDSFFSYYGHGSDTKFVWYLNPKDVLSEVESSKYKDMEKFVNTIIDYNEPEFVWYPNYKIVSLTEAHQILKINYDNLSILKNKSFKYLEFIIKQTGFILYRGNIGHLYTLNPNTGVEWYKLILFNGEICDFSPLGFNERLLEGDWIYFPTLEDAINYINENNLEKEKSKENIYIHVSEPVNNEVVDCFSLKSSMSLLEQGFNVKLYSVKSYKNILDAICTSNYLTEDIDEVIKNTLKSTESVLHILFNRKNIFNTIEYMKLAVRYDIIENNTYLSLKKYNSNDDRAKDCWE